MRRPGAATYVFGNTVSVLATLGVSGWMGYAWWVGQVQGDWIPIAGFMASGAVVNANERLSTYRAWKHSWDIMGGAVPPRRDGMRKMAMVVIWLAMAGWLAQWDYHGQPTHVLALAWFVVWTVMLVWQLRCTRTRPARRPRPEKVFIATVLPAVPRRSPSVAEAMRLLPDYCAGLLASPTANR